MTMAAGLNVEVPFEYSINSGGFRGYNAKTDKATLAALLEHEAVDFIEEDGKVYATQIGDECDAGQSRAITNTGYWGLLRSSKLDTGTVTPTGTYFYEDDGTDVDVFIMDTGIHASHEDFRGRADFEGYDATGEGLGDQNGHGTHCAGTAAGGISGLAGNARLHDVKVLGRSGGGSFAGVIAGINWTAANARERKVGSMSLGGGFSAAVNDAVDAAFRGGVVMVVASGNSNTNACNFSPASAPLSISVNSIQLSNNARSSFSNMGTCTDIFAPGSNVRSAWHTGNTAYNTISGTSMACPHVAGQVAKFWSSRPNLNPAAVKALVLAEAMGGRVTNPGTGSPNRLLFGC